MPLKGLILRSKRRNQRGGVRSRAAAGSICFAHSNTNEDMP